MRREWRGLGCGLWGRMLPSWREKAHEPCSRIASSLDCRLRHLVLRCRLRRLCVVAAGPRTRRLSEPVRPSHSVASASSPPSPSRWSRHSSRWLGFNVSSRRRCDMGHSRFWEGAMICWRVSRMARGAGSRDVTGEIARELRQRCSDEVHGGQRSGGTCLLRPGISDVNLFRYCQGVIYFDAQITNQCRLRADRITWPTVGRFWSTSISRHFPSPRRLSAVHSLARRAISACASCANCPSCQSVAGVRACSVGQITTMLSRIPPR